ncbi:Spo0E family sporulation regulatory protein-aspartic acid phosphatase [Bacillus thuringiensis]|uniref:Spo0E family sporulation regulatory protein-aspartic acid phosphatase n=1 Tax=Bacillus thuringiensis TaxID=1428 RepID=A0A9X7BUE4_BACTU|nr:aspartyl-phosphate phosphatase Spo0E family protein [Bacillus thuringiensis]PGH78182.1 Spo0E family sporulation regulatory protein-aspartic acid phosphatase [Bacillus thuringiensis]
MFTSNIAQLKTQIEEKKANLYRLVKLYGVAHPIPLAYSQELDRLVYHYMLHSQSEYLK